MFICIKRCVFSIENVHLYTDKHVILHHQRIRLWNISLQKGCHVLLFFQNLVLQLFRLKRLKTIRFKSSLTKKTEQLLRSLS